MQLREADRIPGLVPQPPEVGSAQASAQRADKDQAAVFLTLGEALQVPAQLRHDLARERDHAGPGPRLGTGVDQASIVHFRSRYRDADEALVEIELISAKPGQLPEPQVGEGRQQEQCPVARRNLIDQPDQRADRHHRALLGVLLPGALDPAWVAADQPILDRRVHDGVQQAVRLRHRHRPERPGRMRPLVETFLPPAPDIGLVNVAEILLADRRRQMVL
jgi:hypothetical protein